jgi:hypothetical protein
VTLAAIRSPKAEEPCRYEGNRVSCSTDGFKVLTDLAVQHKARADKCEIRLDAATKDVAETSALLQTCRDFVALIPPPKSPLMPLLGLGAGVVGSLLISSGFVAPVPDSGRLAMAGVGLALIGGGVILVWP